MICFLFLNLKLLGYTNYKLYDNTIALQLGDLMKENRYKEWDFSENSDNNAVFEDLFENIQTYGFDYMEKMKDFDNLLNAYEIRVPGLLNIKRDYRLPILYFIKGEIQKGLKFIDEVIERQNQPFDVSSIKKTVEATKLIYVSGYGKVSDEYLRFKENYLELIKNI